MDLSEGTSVPERRPRIAKAPSSTTMTTEASRHTPAQRFAHGAPAVVLVVAAVLECIFPGRGLAAPALLLAVVLSYRLPATGATLIVAVCATVVLLAPSLVLRLLGIPYLLDPPVLATWMLALWFAAALRVADPRARHVGIDQLAHTFEHAPAATAVVSRDGRMVHVNQAFADLLGRELREIPGRTIDEFLGEAAWSTIREEGRALMSGAVGHMSLERAFVRADGRTLWVSIYARLLEDASGRAPYAILQAIDLSEQRRAQRALAASESRFRGIIENSGEIVLVVDEERRVVYANPTAGRLLRRRPSSLVGKPVVELAHASERKGFEDLLAASRGRPRQSLSLRQLRLAKEDSVYLEVHVTALHDTPGIQGTLVSGRVITEQVQAERAVRVSEAKFATIFHSSPDAIMILRNDDSTILDFNDGFTRLLGHKREEAIGEPEPSLRIWADPRDKDNVLQKLVQHQECLDYETRLVAKNGEILHTQISVRYVELEGELCVLCIGRDITQRREAETALKGSEEKFQRIFTNSPDGIVIVSMTDGTVLDINDAFIRSSGFEYEDIVGHRLEDLAVFADRRELDAAATITAKAPGARNLELTFVTKSGQRVPTLISTSIVELGGEKSLLCIAKDIRAQRETEEKLRASEERFRGAFENAPIGMLLVQMDGQIFQANHFALRALAYPESELIGMHVSRLLPPDDRATLKDTFARLKLRNENLSRSERQMLCRNGQEIWTTFHVVLQRGANGEPLYFIIQLADITEMRRSQEKMERMAFYDTLTDLANRRLFSNRLEQAIEHAQRAGSFAALLYLDLDQFKRVNDTLGHEAGDDLLREVARRLADCVRREDTVARPGGDEFTVLLYDIRNPGDAGTVAEKILERLRAPITLSGHQLVVTTSIGITIVPTDSVHPNVLTKNADLAMYRAKERGRNNYQFYAEEMNTRAVTRLKTENELRHGLNAQQFELYYQPKVRLSDDRIVGIECLIRWHHPTRGLLTPDHFISVAEDTGVIIDLGSWVVQEACKAAERLSGMVGFPLEVAVNISPRQFRDAKLVSTIRRCMRETHLEPFQLELEITETMLMDDAEAASLTVRRLHDLGVKLAIDDFGTGYSSLNYLKRFPISTVKVDRSFVMDIPSNTDDMAITAAVIAMSHRLNLEVVAEGIESPAQLSFLKEHRCEFGQGYFFSKPVPMDEVARQLEANWLQSAKTPLTGKESPRMAVSTNARLSPGT